MYSIMYKVCIKPSNKSRSILERYRVKAAKAGDNNGAEDAEKRWYANADAIATFLAAINPYWSREVWNAILHEHLALTKNEAVTMLTGKYEESISTYDEIEKQALEMADMMIYGIMRQFSDVFIEE